ncbi:MAG TPA: hypothetical protein VHS99_24545 [Chloroflexota bacterium]|nr:hypothetical protein [Chloroflexota bacterium]
MTVDEAELTTPDAGRRPGLERCRWPALGEPYSAALRAAVAYILSRFRPVGIVASGTIIRGNPAPSSDLDLPVIVPEISPQRVQRFFRGVPAEIFVNSPATIWQGLERETREDVPWMAHMLATGFVVYTADAVVDELCAAAAATLAAGPRPPAAGELLRRRYFTAGYFQDATDIADTDPEMCAAMLSAAVFDAMRYRFKALGRWQPRAKDVLRALEEVDAAQAARVRAFYRTADLRERLRLAGEIVHRSVGATGFFEWDSASLAAQEGEHR